MLVPPCKILSRFVTSTLFPYLFVIISEGLLGMAIVGGAAALGLGALVGIGMAVGAKLSK